MVGASSRSAARAFTAQTRLLEGLQALLAVVSKGVVSWRYNAIRHQEQHDEIE